MRKTIISIMIASAAIAAVPAAAAPGWRVQPAVQRQIEGDIAQLDRRIDKAAQRGAVSRREATSLRRQADAVERLYVRYRRNGLDRNEVATLESRINDLRQSLRLERRDWDGRRG